ncbi:cytochrome P450, partial [Streptomyces sp. DSM 44918]|nr:cytochrome P450 [Streptomyces sp. DSM 44918]
CEFVSDIAGALPSYVIAELLGISHEDGRRLYHLTETMNSEHVGEATDTVLQAQIEMFEYASALAQRKRAEPGDDIATALLDAEVDGRRLTDLEFNMFFLLMINAGGDTTRNLVSAGTLALMEHPDELARLVADPGLLSTAVE